MTAFADLLADQDAARIYLIHMQPADLTVPYHDVTLNYYFSQGSATPVYGVPGATSDLHLWRARALATLTVQSGIDAGDNILSTIGTSFGILSLANGDGELDELMTRGWDGRRVTIYMGGESFTFPSFEPIASCLAQDAQWDLSTFMLSLRDFDVMLEKDVNQTLYLGTGGYEGPAELLNVPKPLCYGKVRNVAPIQIDDDNGQFLVYQIHDGAIQSVDAVYDMMNPYVSDGDTADVYAWVNVPGHYVTDLSRGLIRLGNKIEAGAITVDAHGDATGTYAITAAQIIERILLTKTTAPVMDASYLDAASFTQLDSDAPYEMGVYITAPTPIREVVDYLLGSCGAGRYWTRNGTLVVKQIRFGTSQGTVKESHILRIARRETILPPWQRCLSYSRNYSPASDDDRIAGVVVGSARTLAKQEYRKKMSVNVYLKNSRPLAETQETETALSEAADAATEAERQMTLFGSLPVIATTLRHSYDLTLRRQQFLYNPLDTITVQHDRFGLSSGRDFIVLAVGEDTTSGETELKVWG